MPSERLLLNDKTPGFEFNPGPETRLDRSELLIKFYESIKERKLLT